MSGGDGSGNPAAIVVGATSGIGRALGRALADRGYDVALAGRDAFELDRCAADLRVRHRVDAAAEPLDVLDFDAHGPFLDRCLGRFGDRLDLLILCHGAMADEDTAEADFATARRMIDVNYTASVSLLDRAARHFRERGSGTLCAVTSVAGDRGRQSNYHYGSTKAALSSYLQGLRHRLAPHGVRVLTVKPGFVDTGLTWGLLKPGSPLVASPERVAGSIAEAVRRRRDQIYAPWFWRWIMLIIRSVPEPLFKRTKL